MTGNRSAFNNGKGDKDRTSDAAAYSKNLDAIKFTPKDVDPETLGFKKVGSHGKRLVKSYGAPPQPTIYGVLRSKPIVH